jgi:hypothetical protein
VFKTELKTAEVYDRMVDERGVDLKYVLKDIPETTLKYNPNDYSPWSWA